MNPHLLLYGLVFVMVLCWSGNYVAAKIVFREMPALLVMSLRTVISAALMLPIYLRRPRTAVSIWTRREMGLLILLGIGGMMLNQLFWTLGVARTTVVLSSMIMATTPVFVLFMAGMMGIERITLPKILRALETLEPRIEIDPAVAVRARRAVERMTSVRRDAPVHAHA